MLSVVSFVVMLNCSVGFGKLLQTLHSDQMQHVK